MIEFNHDLTLKHENRIEQLYELRYKMIKLITHDDFIECNIKPVFIDLTSYLLEYEPKELSSTIRDYDLIGKINLIKALV